VGVVKHAQLNIAMHPDDAAEMKALARERGVPMRQLVVASVLGREARKPPSEVDVLREDLARLTVALPPVSEEFIASLKAEGVSAATIARIRRDNKARGGVEAA
jgi:hypothetical protein